MKPFWQSDQVTLYHGDGRRIVPQLGAVDCVITDPPYGETNHGWDHWPAGWPGWLQSDQLWCFTSLRTLLLRQDDFRAAGWSLAQEIVWEKHNGSSAAADRFRRVHELAVHWYRGRWSGLHHQVPRVPAPEGQAIKGVLTRVGKPRHWAGGAGGAYTYSGTRQARSVIKEPVAHLGARHPTEKPLGMTRQMVTYSVPPGGLILDPFCGCGTTCLAALLEGRRAIGIDRSRTYLRAAIERLESAARGVPAARPWQGG